MPPFERAVDAIVSGDIATLRTLLEQHPGLVRERSQRSHRSTLLHYVSANGVEDDRQKTPPNIVEIARLLLDAGADVAAESEAYGGHSTVLGLAATSCHPERAGVQIAMLELLLERGAVIDGADPAATVTGCLHNGRGEAAEFLASHGAKLDLEGAAGVGRLDIVKSSLPSAAPKQVLAAFAWACEFGRTEVVEFLLDHGVAVDARVPHHNGTGLHWAAWGGHAETVMLLLTRGAARNLEDETYHGTPAGWARYAGHPETAAMLEG